MLPSLLYNVTYLAITKHVDLVLGDFNEDPLLNFDVLLNSVYFSDHDSIVLYYSQLTDYIIIT